MNTFPETVWKWEDSKTYEEAVMYSQIFLHVLQHSVIMFQFVNLILKEHQNFFKALGPAQRGGC